jgi:hypothetical protein
MHKCGGNICGLVWRKEIALAVISEWNVRFSARQEFGSTAEEMKRRCTFVAGVGRQEVEVLQFAARVDGGAAVRRTVNSVAARTAHVTVATAASWLSDCTANQNPRDRIPAPASQKFAGYYGTRMFIALSATACNFSLTQSRLNQSTIFHLTLGF